MTVTFDDLPGPLWAAGFVSHSLTNPVQVQTGCAIISATTYHEAIGKATVAFSKVCKDKEYPSPYVFVNEAPNSVITDPELAEIAPVKQGVV